MPQPLFILGKHRSGTTWLANMVCELPHFVGIQHAAHFGIHESGYFHHVENRFGDLSNRARYDEFVEAMAASDYFRLAGADSEYLGSLWPTTYPGVFRAVMDRFAALHEADCWVEKSPSHTPLVDRIAGYYPDAVFVSVRRKLDEVLSSTLAIWVNESGRLNRMGSMARTAASWAMYERCVARFAKRSTRILMIRYEDLSNDPRCVLERVCDLVGVPYDGQLPASRFEPNTSFPAGSARRSERVRPGEMRVASLVAALVGAVPTPLLLSVHRWKHRRASSQSLPSWFYTLRADALSDLESC